MSSISGDFVSWVLERCQERSGGKLMRGANLFDERDAELGTKVQKALNQKLMLAVAVSVPRLERLDRSGADDTVQVCSVEVGIVRSALSKEDSLVLAEKLYRAFSGADWQPAGGPDCGPCDVSADSLFTEVTAKAMSHSFTVSTRIYI